MRGGVEIQFILVLTALHHRLLAFASHFGLKGVTLKRSDRCLPITDYSFKVPVLYMCAHMCLYTYQSNCTVIGYSPTTRTCSLGNKQIGQQTNRSVCPAEETTFQMAIRCEGEDCCDSSAGWEYSPARHSCIKAMNNPRAWDEADVECQSMGAYLAIFDSQETINVVQNLFQTKNEVWDDGDWDWFLVGLMRKGNNWIWDSGSTWIAWHTDTNQPTGNGDCARLSTEFGTLDDIPCDDGFLRPFICERDAF